MFLTRVQSGSCDLNMIGYISTWSEHREGHRQPEEDDIARKGSPTVRTSRKTASVTTNNCLIKKMKNSSFDQRKFRLATGRDCLLKHLHRIHHCSSFLHDLRNKSGDDWIPPVQMPSTRKAFFCLTVSGSQGTYWAYKTFLHGQFDVFCEFGY
ncbi:hypothetical protein TNCV_3669281 [Trichonephila clavipes]|nr:hypothetical protein TNCV_3669281 [Trichonephila clavipes]